MASGRMPGDFWPRVPGYCPPGAASDTSPEHGEADDEELDALDAAAKSEVSEWDPGMKRPAAKPLSKPSPKKSTSSQAKAKAKAKARVKQPAKKPAASVKSVPTKRGKRHADDHDGNDGNDDDDEDKVDKAKDKVSKPKTKAKSKAKASVAKSKKTGGLGCSKCRYAVKGCGVCRKKLQEEAEAKEKKEDVNDKDDTEKKPKKDGDNDKDNEEELAAWVVSC